MLERETLIRLYACARKSLLATDALVNAFTTHTNHPKPFSSREPTQRARKGLGTIPLTLRRARKVPPPAPPATKTLRHTNTPSPACSVGRRHIGSAATVWELLRRCSHSARFGEDVLRLLLMNPLTRLLRLLPDGCGCLHSGDRGGGAGGRPHAGADRAVQEGAGVLRAAAVAATSLSDAAGLSLSLSPRRTSRRWSRTSSGL